MTNLSKDLRTRLKEQAEVRAPAISADQLAADGTRKWRLQVDSNNAIETVFIPESDRGTMCIVAGRLYAQLRLLRHGAPGVQSQS